MPTTHERIDRPSLTPPARLAFPLPFAFAFAFAAAALVAVSMLGCAADASDDAGGLAAALRHGPAFDRIVAGRIYQHDQWMLPAADGYQPARYPTLVERRVAYVCDALAAFEPTYVTGLIRLDATDVITDEMATVFRGVKQCIRARVDHPVRFDVVLNALHYADGDYVRTASQGETLLRQRLRSADDALHPEMWFFDFYCEPFNRTGHEYHPQALRTGLQWIHANGQLAGGHLWGNNVPRGTDYIVVTSRGGMSEVRRQVAKVDRDIPIWMHVRNDPQIPGSEGLAFISGTLDERRDLVTTHARHQDDVGYRYAYPVFFPMADRFGSYDAVQDGSMMPLMLRLAEQHNPVEHGRARPATTSASTEPGAASAAAALAPYELTTPLWRYWNPYNQDHFYTTERDDDALLDAGWGYETEEGRVFRTAEPGTIPLYRYFCGVGCGDHFYTTNRSEGDAATSYHYEGIQGYVFATEVAGSVPLQRYVNPANTDHFYTIDRNDEALAAFGYHYEGIAAYVYP